MEKKSIIQIGGTVENAVKGDFIINKQAILKEAWQKTLHSRLPINLGLLFVLVLGTIVSLIVSDNLGGLEVIISDPKATMILNVIVTLFIWPFLAGVEMMGVFHAVGMKTQPKLIFSFLKRGSWVAICALLTSLLISIGLQLFILPGIFLAVALSLVIPLVVEKQLSPIQAITLSIKSLRFNWFKIFSVYLMLFSALVGSLLPLMLLAQVDLSVIGSVIFFFCLSYLAPFYYNVKGILYREIFGLQVLESDVDNPPSSLNSNDTFSA